MATATADFPNRPFRLRLETWFNWQSGATASIHVEVWIDKLSYSPTSSGSGSSGAVYVMGGLNNSWSGGYNFVSGDTFLIAQYDTTTGLSDAGQYSISASANYDILGATATPTIYVQGTALTTPPAPSPVNPTPDQITINSMRYRFQGNGYGGGTFDHFEFQYANNPSFSGATTIADNGGNTTVSGLTAGTTYYFRSRGVNSVGPGAWSAVSQGTTLPSTPPTLAITPSLNGQSASVKLTPPGGISGVTEYNIEYRPVGGSTVATTTTGTTKTINGLTPGITYEWRANAEIGSYTSPWTSWQAVLQPAPNTNPGDYFDGATAAKTDTTYAWTGTANGSTSTATGKNVTGWRTFLEGNSASGGSGSVMQATGGYMGAFAARVTFISDTTAAGFIAGVAAAGAAVVAAGGAYVGSIFVRLDRTQRLEAGIAWYNGSTLLSITWGDDVVVAASTSTFTRLIATGEAPATATKGAPVVRDVSGASWSTWKGGDVMILDAAMISLGQLFPYFDGSLPDTTYYSFEWSGTANASSSKRFGGGAGEAVVLDPLADPDCDPIPLPPVPPVIPSDCIDEVGAWRRYTLAVPATEVREWSSTLPTLVLITGTEAERQVRVRMYPNPDGVAPDQVDKTVWDSEQIISYVPPATEITMDAVTERVWASVGGDELLAADTLLYGTGGEPATWPEMRCGIGYVFTLDVPSDSPLGNLNTRVLLTQRM